MVGMALLINAMHTAARTAVVRSTQQIVYMITVQPNKDAQLNEWLGMALLRAMHTCSSALLHYYSTQQIVYMITVQLQSKMPAGMNGWHGSAC
jgi:hypothetical protein